MFRWLRTILCLVPKAQIGSETQQPALPPYLEHQQHDQKYTQHQQQQDQQCSSKNNNGSSNDSHSSKAVDPLPMNINKQSQPTPPPTPPQEHYRPPPPPPACHPTRHYSLEARQLYYPEVTLKRIYRKGTGRKIELCFGAGYYAVWLPLEEALKFKLGSEISSVDAIWFSLEGAFISPKSLIDVGNKALADPSQYPALDDTFFDTLVRPSQWLMWKKVHDLSEKWKPTYLHLDADQQWFVQYALFILSGKEIALVEKESGKAHRGILSFRKVQESCTIVLDKKRFRDVDVGKIINGEWKVEYGSGRELDPTNMESLVEPPGRPEVSTVSHFHFVLLYTDLCNSFSVGTSHFSFFLLLLFFFL